MPADRAGRPYGLGFRVLLWLVPCLLDWYMRLVDWTSRKTVLNEEYDTHLSRRETTIYAGWHQGLLLFIEHFRNRGFVVMASRSKDGEIVSAVLRRFGWVPVRGSSSAGGREALVEMIEIFGGPGVGGGLVVDAPRGPYGEPKIGIVKLARDAGRPLVPVSLWARPCILGRNWDRTILPLPFSRIVLKFGEPIAVPADASAEECEHIRRHLAEKLMEELFAVQGAAGAPRRDFRPRPTPQAAEPAA